VRELIEEAGATLRFLPPYSPDFNPIENAFSKLKAMLRRASERTVSGLWDLIGRLVDIIQPHECANYFSSCGYGNRSRPSLSQLLKVGLRLTRLAPHVPKGRPQMPFSALPR
jgi:hypothetical protein